MYCTSRTTAVLSQNVNVLANDDEERAKGLFKKLDRIHEEDPRQPDSPRSYASARPIARETWRDQDQFIYI